ncbi:MAG: hypothetical protein WC664_01480 [Patescibacteria group bacterium]|jgi:hypothetical protein
MLKEYFISLREDKYKRHIALAFFLFALFLMLFTEPYLNTFNIVSRYLTIESIVENNSFIIDEKHEASDDMIYRDGHYYSSKPPILSVAASSVYYVSHNFFGQDFPEFNEVNKLNYYFSLYPTVYVTSLIFVGFTFWLMLLYFYKAIKLFSIKKEYHLPLILGLGLGTLFFSYAITLNNHTIAGALLFIAFYYLLLIKKEGYNPIKLNKYLSLVGLLVSLAATIDVPVGLTFFAMFFIYFLNKIGFKKIFYYLWPAVIIFSVHSYFNYQAFGGLLPAQAYKQYWIGPDNEPILSTYFTQTPWYMYIFNIFIGTHGFFVYTPLLFVSFYSIYKNIKEKTAFRWEALMILFALLVITVFYTIFARDYGGSAYGFRWFIAITPLIYFFTIFLCQETWNKKLTLIVIVFFIWSALVAIIGAYDPWPPGAIFEKFGQVFPIPPIIVVLHLIRSSILF